MSTGITSPKLTTKRRLCEWSSPRAYIVPRTLCLPVPQGWELVRPPITGNVGPYLPPFIVTGSNWSSEVAQRMDGIAIVGGVRLSIWQAQVPGYTRHLWGPWGDVKVRRMITFALPHGAGLRVSAATSRQGEVLCWPLRKLPREPMDLEL